MRVARLLAAGAGLTAALLTPAAAKDDWDPVAPADLAATASPSAPGADLEYLFRRASLSEDREGTVFRHYVRAKIYTQRGVENAGMLSIEYPDLTAIRGLAARVVKVDGTIIDLKKADFFESTVLKLGDVKWKKTSLAFPNLAPRDIVEFRWTESTNLLGPSLWTYCQWDVPVREFKFAVEAGLGYMRLAWFNCGEVTQKKVAGDRMELTIRNIPPFVAEDHLNADRDWRGWIRLTYSGEEVDVEKGWKNFSAAAHDFFLANTKPNDALRQKAAELTAGTQTDRDKLQRLYEFCQKEIANLTWDDTLEAREARRKGATGDFQSARQALKARRGWGNEITYLFGALARSAGFDARRAQNASSNAVLRTTSIPQGWNFMTELAVAIRLDGHWAFFAPGEAFVPFGMRHWSDEGTIAVICDAKALIFDSVPVSPAAKNLTARKAHFVLDGSGDLSGEVEETLTGQAAIQRKTFVWGQNQEKVDDDFKAEITKRLPSAEVTNIRWENLRSIALPLIVRYAVRVPGYADQIGQRLALRPGFFRVGARPEFTAPKRIYPISFPYAWSEKDEVEIKLPAGFEMEKPTVPADLRDTGNLQTANYTLRYYPQRRTLLYTREYAFGGEGHDLFKPEGYEQLKHLFNVALACDTHALVLKPQAAAEEVVPSPAPARSASTPP